MKNYVILLCLLFAVSCNNLDFTESENSELKGRLKSTTPIFGTWNESISGYGDRTTYQFKIGDLNEDGYYDDILRIGQDGVGWINYGDDGINDAWDTQIGTLGASNSNEFVLAQFNGVGTYDLLKVGNDGVASYSYYVNSGLTWTVLGTWGSQNGSDYYSGDFNADGYSDVLQTNNNGYAGMNFSYNYGLDALFDLPSLQWGANTSNEFKIGDFDGDGKDDVLKVGNDGKAWINKGNDGFTDAWDQQPGTWGDQRTNAFTTGDFDTDGKDDVLKIGDNGNAFINYAGDGLTDAWDLTLSSYGSQSSFDFLIGDFDRDGRPDIMKIGSNGVASVDYAAQ